jgi:hypothetical protein
VEVDEFRFQIEWAGLDLDQASLLECRFQSGWSAHRKTDSLVEMSSRSIQ